MNKIRELYAWTGKQDNWVSAATHGAICAGWMTIGLAIAYVSTLADDTLAGSVVVFFAGMCIGGYTLRELDDARKAIGAKDEGRKLGEGYEDWIAAVVVTVALGVIYHGLIGG